MRGRGAVNTDEFIREVDEAVRQDRWLQLWKQHGAYIVAGALAIVVGTAAGVGWRNYQASQRLDEARRYAAAAQLLRQDHAKEAADAFLALARTADGGYGTVARLRAAEAQERAGEAAAATQSLGQLSDDSKASPAYRRLGDLLAAQSNFDHTDPKALIGRLEGLTAADQSWRYSALELEALAQIRAGDVEAARRTLNVLLDDPRTPADLSRRAAELMTALGGSPGEDAGTAAGDQPGAAAGDQSGAPAANQPGEPAAASQ
jgi:hypothetical protein